MKRFVRNNLLLVIVIAASIVVAIGLLVFSILKYIEMSASIDTVKKLREKVIELGKKKPQPVEGNKIPIAADQKLYRQTADGLQQSLQSPMKALATRFVGLLQLAPEKDEKGNLVPPQTEKDEKGNPLPLSTEKFVTIFNEMWNRSESYVDKNFNYEVFRNHKFINWRSALYQVMPEVAKLTTEPLTEESTTEVLLASIGIPRRLDTNPELLERFMRNYQAQLAKILSEIKYDTTTKADWFGFEPDRTAIAGRFTNPNDQYPQVCTIWDILGDIVTRMVACKKKIIVIGEDGKEQAPVPWSIELENKLADKKAKFRMIDDKIDTFESLRLRAVLSPQADKDAWGRAISGEENGLFRFYRFRLKISGSMESVRTMVKELSAAVKDHRFYIVRSVAFSTMRDGAAEIFAQNDAQYKSDTVQQNTPAQPQEGRGGRGGRGGRRGPAMEEEQHQKAELTKKEIEEKKRAEALRKRREEEEKKRPYYQQIGYGDILIGDDKKCSAEIDFDYVVLK